MNQLVNKNCAFNFHLQIIRLWKPANVSQSIYKQLDVSKIIEYNILLEDIFLT